MPQKDVILNAMQLAAIGALRAGGAKHLTIEAGRGTGKSTILGWYVKEAVRQMPRATGIIVGNSFVQIKSRTLPSTKEGLEMFGFYENIDYVVGKCGKNLGFELPFQAPNSWQNVIHFSNGFIWVLVSLDDPNSGRGLNSYIVIGDEAALLDHERLFNNVLTTNRAKKIQFDKCALVNSTIFTSTVALTQRGEWFTAREKLALDAPKKYAFIKANSYVNIENLKPGWIDEMKDNAASELLFNAEILNIRPKVVENSFYASLNASVHYYKYAYDNSKINLTNGEKISCNFDADVRADLPLIVSFDFGGRINCCVVAQFDKQKNTIYFLKDFFVKTPQILTDLVLNFCEYYKPQLLKNKDIYLYHDRNGYKQEANSKTTLAQDVVNLLRGRGWKVYNKTPHTNNPPHIEKYRLINEMLGERSIVLPKIRINEQNCPNLVVSIENATTSHKNDSFEKDKSSERSSVILQQHATHLSDAFDYMLFWQFFYLIDYNFHESFPVNILP